MASQGSDKLKAILAQAQAKAQAVQATQAALPELARTDRVEALLDRNEALPDPRALARMYRSHDLVARLPEDEDSAVPDAPVAPANVPAPPPPLPALPDAAEAARVAPRLPDRPPLSPAQIREVMNELRGQFTPGSYMTYEATPNPVDVIPMPEDDEVGAGPVEEPLEEPSERFYLAGALIAMAVIGIFVLLALNGPLRYRPPAAVPSSSPSASARG